MPHRIQRPDHHQPGFPPGLRLMAHACAQLHAAQAHLAQEGECLHDGIHQARKCIRRARSILKLGRRALGKRAHRLDEDLGQLCRGLSPLRDGQALIEALRRLDRSADPGLAELLPAAEDAARRRRDRLLLRTHRHDPGFERRRQRLAALQARLARLDWEAVDERRIARSLARGERRAIEAGDAARLDPADDGRWHVYRRRLRRLRQQLTALEELGIAAPAVRQDLLDQAAALGEAQDDVLLLRHCRHRPVFPAGMRARLRAAVAARIAAARRASCQAAPG